MPTSMPAIACLLILHFLLAYCLLCLPTALPVPSPSPRRPGRLVPDLPHLSTLGRRRGRLRVLRAGPVGPGKNEAGRSRGGEVGPVAVAWDMDQGGD